MGAMTENEWRYNQLIKRFPSEAEPPFEERRAANAGGAGTGAAPPMSAGCGSS